MCIFSEHEPFLYCKYLYKFLGYVYLFKPKLKIGSSLFLCISNRTVLEPLMSSEMTHRNKNVNKLQIVESILNKRERQDGSIGENTQGITVVHCVLCTTCSGLIAIICYFRDWSLNNNVCCKQGNIRKLLFSKCISGYSDSLQNQSSGISDMSFCMVYGRYVENSLYSHTSHISSELH